MHARCSVPKHQMPNHIPSSRVPDHKYQKSDDRREVRGGGGRRAKTNEMIHLLDDDIEATTWKQTIPQPNKTSFNSSTWNTPLYMTSMASSPWWRTAPWGTWNLGFFPYYARTSNWRHLLWTQKESALHHPTQTNGLKLFLSSPCDD